MVLLDNLIFLVRNVKPWLDLHEVVVLCRLVECLITAIVLQKNGIDFQDKSATENTQKNNSIPFELKEIPKELLSRLNDQRRYVKEFIKGKVAFHDAKYITRTQWSKELQVSDIKLLTCC